MEQRPTSRADVALDITLAVTRESMPTSKRIATPAWREFERLVARIEQVLAGEKVQVVSPDRVRSLITGRMREVDASLRTRVGSSDVLITIECRKRDARQDVTWIEQLGCKRQAIGAARTIAVASTAFSRDAIQAAEHYGIDLRLLSEIGDAELQNWVLPRFVVHVYKQCDLVEPPEIIFLAERSDDFSVNPPMQGIEDGATNPNSAVFVTSDGTTLTLNDLWLRADEQLKIFENIPKDDQAHVLRVNLISSEKLNLRTRLGLRQVDSIRMAMSLRWKHERIALSAANVVSYRPASMTDKMEPQLRAEFESKEAAGTNIRVGIQFQPGRDVVSLSLQLTPGKK